VRSREVREGGEREGGKTDGAEEGEEKKDSRPAIVEWRVEDISSQQRLRPQRGNEIYSIGVVGKTEGTNTCFSFFGEREQRQHRSMKREELIDRQILQRD